MGWQLLSGLRRFRAYLRFMAHSEVPPPLVVYSEGPAYWPHLGPVVQALLDSHAVPVVYVSSSPEDPGLHLRHERLRTLEVGDGAVRTLFFHGLKAQIVLMTMPDLDQFHLKRSRGVGQYVYLHHALVSLHMVYRAHAFDAYDVMFCAGPHHAVEMAAIARQHGIQPPRLVAHGYGRLDALLGAAQRQPPPREDGARTVLVAPSWGPEGLLERHAEPLLAALANSAWRVIVRPHPQTVRLSPEAVQVVRKWCRQAGNIQLDEAFSGQQSLLDAHVMVSDWSGAAFDFALGLGRPVLFVDVPRKVNNPAYPALGIEPVEVTARPTLGQVISPDQLAGLPGHLDALLTRPAEDFSDALATLAHHPGHSAAVAARWLADALQVP